MNLSFGNAALLWGALLFTVPLVIHLLNRRRYKVVPWAAQDFLLQAYRKTRRRLTFESLLLLLLRCLLIILLAFAMAQPFVPNSSLLSVFSPTQRDVVIVVDTSYSTGRMLNSDETVMENLRAQATLLLEGLSEERGDEVSLVTLADVPTVILSSTSDISRAREAVDRLSPSWRSADLVRTLDLLTENVLGDRAREVYIFTDLQRETFNPGARESAGDSLAGAASPASAWRVAAGHESQFFVIDVGDQADPVNLTVEDLVCTPANVVVGEVTRFTGTVRNRTNHEVKKVTGTFVFDEDTERGTTVTFDVPAGGLANVECSMIFRDEGMGRRSHSARFTIDEDDLLADNERYLAFVVHEAVNVLVVDGDHDRRANSLESLVVADMLNPSDDPEASTSVFKIKVIDDRKFNLRSEELANYDLFVLVNVGRIDERVAEELDDVVRAGRGLLIFLGDQVDPRSYNERLHRLDGSGLLPARLLDAKGDTLENSDAAFGLVVRDYYHPIVRFFSDPILTSALLDIPVRRFFSTEVTLNDKATKVVVELDDDPASPSALILEKAVGRGRVVLFTTSADESWAGFSQDSNVISFLPLIQETATYLTLTDASTFNLSVGDPIRRTTRSIPSEVSVTTPANTLVPMTDTPREMEYGEFVLPSFNTTSVPGIYSLELEYPLAGAGNDAGRKDVEFFAVNVTLPESDLLRVEPEAFADLYPGVELSFLTEVDVVPLDSSVARAGEFWRVILWALVTLLSLEMLLAWWLGQKAGGAHN